MKLDLGCGKRCAEGFVGVDISPIAGADRVYDLRLAWPWLDNSITEARSSHFIEHLTGPERIHFMNELWRVLVPGGKAEIITPYWTSSRSAQDPTHVFPPICEQSYLYFDRVWRQANKLDYYPITANFTFEYTFVYNPEVGFPSYETQELGAKHYFNVIDDLVVTLKREE